MKIEVRNKIILGSIAALSLATGFLLIRYTFFEVHLMSQWPLVLFLFGIVVIAVSASLVRGK